MTRLFITGFPSSEIATQPARRKSPTFASPAARARSSMNSVIAWLSLTGTVLGIQQTDVKPPATAAAAPLWIDSLYSKPGSRKWTWTVSYTHLRAHETRHDLVC